MLPTPSTSHVSFDNVYEPAEDSYLFLDTLSSASEMTWLHSNFRASPTDPRPAPLLLELGPGSGVIVAFLTAHASTIFGTDVLSMSVDVNWHACLATRTTVQRAVAETQANAKSSQASTAGRLNGASVYLTSMIGDLTTAIRPGSVDVLIFNPPYVPTDSVPSMELAAGSEIGSVPTFEDSSHLLSLSYAGGHDGMEVTNRLLLQIPEILSARGVAYVLFCRGNKPDDVKREIRAWESSDLRRWHAETVGTSGKTAGWEKLEIVRIWRE